MKVTGPNSANSATGPQRARGAATASGFSLPAAGAASGAAGVVRSAGVTGVASLDALIALQDVGGPLERRRRAVNRAGRILDVLDEVKVALLDGALPPAALDSLMRAVKEQREGTDDPKLEGVLDEIETRAAVELAKLEVGRHAA